MDKSIPPEWIDRIFHRLGEIYGAGFTDRIRSTDSFYELEKTRWRNGLYGATADEIKKVIELCRIGIIRRPPSVIDFYHYCKGHNLPPIRGLTSKDDQSLVNKLYQQLIRDVDT